MSPDDIKQLARNFFRQVWNDGDEAAIDRYIVANARGNDPDFGVGREAFRKQWKQWRAAFPDLHFEVEDVIAEGDKVLTRWTLTGTHQGEFMGVPATGRAIRVTGMSLDVIEDGMIAEGFDGWDAWGLRQQLGAI
ncbi:MAG TPA: ester cyclase [Thermomicrobiales bacterium]|nr:ester cyclase [Thermomicrobiales bacterium]